MTSSKSPHKAPIKSPGKRQKGFPWLRWLFIGLFVALVYDVMTGPSGLLHLRALSQDNAAKREAIDSLQGLSEELAVEKRRLVGDSAYLEAMARRELGMAKPGEKVYRFIDRPSR